MRIMRGSILITIIILLALVLSCANDDLPAPDNDTRTVQKFRYIGYGAQETVSGSLHVLNADDEFYLIDIGSFMGDEGENYPLPRGLTPEKIKAVLVTHAHEDHVGRLLLLMHKGYLGSIYMTQITYDMMKVTLQRDFQYVDLGPERFYYSKLNRSERKPVYLDGYDFGRFTVQRENRVYIRSSRPELNRKGFYLSPKQAEKLVEELLERLEKQVRIVHPGDSRKIGLFDVDFIHTAHIPGAVMIKLSLDDFTLFFSGDAGGGSSPLLKPNPEIHGSINALIVEGTYKYDRDTEYPSERIKFQKEIGALIDDGFRIVIPAFVLDRTQQILFEIINGMDNGVISPVTPVKIYSPSAKIITDFYERYTTDDFILEKYFADDMKHARFKPEYYIDERVDLNNDDDPLELQYGEIGIMSSGMCDHVYSRRAVIDYINDEMTVFFFVGYQAPDSPGGMLTTRDASTNQLQPPEIITLDGETLEVNAKIKTTNAFSSHADPSQILDMFSEASIDKIFLTHLNPENIPELSQRYEDGFGAEVIALKLGERYYFWGEPQKINILLLIMFSAVILIIVMLLILSYRKRQLKNSTT